MFLKYVQLNWSKVYQFDMIWYESEKNKERTEKNIKLSMVLHTWSPAYIQLLNLVSSFRLKAKIENNVNIFVL